MNKRSKANKRFKVWLRSKPGGVDVALDYLTGPKGKFAHYTRDSFLVQRIEEVPFY